MAGEYSDLFDEPAVAPKANLNLRFGVEASPDQAAEAAQLARRYKLPVGVVSEFREDYKQKAQVDDARAVVDQSPKLRGWLAADMNNASIAHDDVQTLGGIESALSSIASAARYVTSADDKTGLGNDVRAGYHAASGGASGAFRAAFEFAASGVEGMFPVIRFNEQQGAYGGNPLRRIAEGFGEIASEGRKRSEAAGSKFEGTLGKGVASGIQSLTQNIITAPLMLAPGGQGAALTAMSSQAGGASYQKARELGIDQNTALAYGASDAAIEFATEKLPMAKLLGDLKANTGLLKMIVSQGVREVPGEQVATALQDMNEWAVLHPDRPFSEYLQERPGAAAQTLIATLVGVGGQTTLMRAIDGTLNGAERQKQSAESAEVNAQRIEQLTQLATASKLNSRDATTFKALVAEIADEQGDAPTEFFIDATTLVNSLNQSGMSMAEVEAVAPTVAAQLGNPTGDIRVPVSEFLLAGEAVTAPLIDHLRTSEDAMTRAEAAEYLKTQGDTIRADVESELQKRDDSEVFRQSIEGVRAQFETELNNAKRFTPAVNRAYSDLLANFYGAQASRLSMTPEALLDKYKLRVQAQGLDGERTLNQADASLDAVREAWSGAGIKHAISEQDGTIEVSQIVVPEDKRGQGAGTEAMQKLLAYADATGQRVVFTPSSDFGGTKSRLEKFYKGLGFAANKGRSRDFTTRATMIREPKTGGTLNQSATPEQAALSALSQSDEIFSLPKSTQDTIGAIAADIDPTIKVRADLAEGLDRYILTMPDGSEASIFVRTPSPYGPQSYGSRVDDGSINKPEIVRPGEEAFDMRAVDDVWINVSQLKSGGGGGKVYAIAGDFAHNTGKVFIGDPAGVSDAAMRRRPEQMLSSALRWGTTEHLAPHPRQVAGAPEIGIPPLKWVAGDDIGNIRRLIEVNIKALENAGYDDSLISFDASTGSFRDSGGQELSRADIDSLSKATDLGSAGLAGGRTLARGSVLRALLREESAGAQGQDGQRDGLLARAARLRSDSPEATRELFQGSEGVTPRAQIAFPADIAGSPSVISLLAGADLSSFLHESGHFFLEVQSDLAARIQQQIDSGASVTPAERGVVDDMNRLLEWFGVKGSETLSPLDEWSTMTLDQKREHHEQFARGFEAFTMEGRAPSIALQEIFSRFRSWLVQVYKTLRGLNVELNDDVRAVMGRMLATDFAIEEAEAQRAMGPLFKDAEKAGMTLDEFNAYQETAQAATDKAAAELQTRGMKDMKWLSRARDKALKARQMEVDDLRRDIKSEVRSEVMREPVYQAWQALTGKAPKALEISPEELASRQERTDWKERRSEAEEVAKKSVRDELLAKNPEVKGLLKGQFLAKNKRQIDIDVQQRMLEWDQANPQPAAVRTEVDVEPGFIGKLDAKLVKSLFPAQEAGLAARKMLGKEGADPDVAADVFGFDSGDAMVKALADAMPPQEVIDARTDQRMLEMFGDIASPEALQRAADEAVHNEARARFIATEMKALEAANKVREKRGKTSVDVLARAAKDYAQQIIARLKVREIKPNQYAMAEARSAKQAEKAFMAGKTEEAATHKRNQLVNNYATKAAYEAQEEVASAQKYFRKFDKRSKAIDAGYLDQIELMLERFDFRQASLKEIDRRKSFSAWVEEQRADGIEPNVPAELLDEANRKSYKDMTLEELRGLRETVEQIEHLGRLKNRLLLARDQRDFDAAASEMAASIIEYGGKARPVQLEGPNPAVDWFAGVAAQHRKLASLFRQMDGNKDSGPMFDLIGRGMNERGTMEDVMSEKATMALRDLYAPIMKLKGGVSGYRSKLFIPEINASLTRGGRLAVALNWGNEANRQRVMDGDKWSEGQVLAIIKTLTPVELKFVNDTWAYLDSFWPEVAAKEKRLTGVEPEKVEALPFNVTAADGTEVAMRGGYYPLKYDAERSDRASQQEAAEAAKEMMQGAFTRATTRRGHTKARAEEVKRAVRKDLNVITQHVTQVVHDLAWHEWLIDTNKLIGDERVAGAIRDHYGPKVLKTIRDGVMGIATADVAPQTDIDKALLKLRSNVTRATMGASLTTAFLQPFGLTQSMVRIGPKHVLRGMARWGGEAVRMENSLAWVHEKSDFMRLRAKTFNKELREIRGAVGGKSRTMTVIDAGLFAMMQKMQMIADVPTWIGQYEKSISEGQDEATAVAQADRMVLEAQGGGQTKDLAEVQRKHPMLTQFYSYFSVTLNLAAEQTAATDFKNPAAVAGWLGDMALLMVIPAILPSFIMYALKGGDDEDEKAMAKRIVEWQVGYLLGTVVGVRELSGAVGGFDYAGPPVGRLIGDVGKVGKQASQGELDEPAVMAAINLMGSAFGIPTVQATRSYKGWKAWDEGQEGAGPQSVLFGPPPKN
jgi:predicted GNAT family acetyltransferase